MLLVMFFLIGMALMVAPETACDNLRRFYGL